MSFFCSYCPKPMVNYFELLGIEASLGITKSQLDQALISIQRKNHPDMLINASDAEKAAASELSNLANTAYKQLKSLDGRIEHLLAINGYNSDNSQARLSQSFLVEAFSWHEDVLHNRDAILSKLNQLRSNCYKTIELHCKNDDFASAFDEFAKLKFVSRFFYEHGGEDEVL